MNIIKIFSLSAYRCRAGTTHLASAGPEQQALLLHFPGHQCTPEGGPRGDKGPRHRVGGHDLPHPYHRTAQGEAQYFRKQNSANFSCGFVRQFFEFTGGENVIYRNIRECYSLLLFLFYITKFFLENTFHFKSTAEKKNFLHLCEIYSKTGHLFTCNTFLLKNIW